MRTGTRFAGSMLGVIAAATPLVGVAAAAAATPGQAAAAPNRPVPARTTPDSSGGTRSIQASSNWSGYGFTGGPYTAITGQWTVAPVSRTSGSTYSSSWIGIDGFANNDLIQTGTEADWYSGAAHYYAWWEILPASETRTNLAVRPGDVMKAAVTKQSGSSWLISITDSTTGQNFSTTQSYSGPGSSAEWIQERPQINGNLAALAKYGKITFTNSTVNGASPGFTASEEIEMTNNSGSKVISIPSAPNAERNGFTVAYGSKAPAPPA